MRKFGSIWGRVVSARIAVAEIEMEPIVSKIFQVLRKPERVGKAVAFRDLHIEGGPAPPSQHVVFRNATVVQLANGSAVILQLRMIVRACGEHNRFSRQALAVVDGQAELDNIFLWSLAYTGFFVGGHNLGGSGAIDREPRNAGTIRRGSCLQMKDGQQAVSAESAEKYTFLALLVVDQLAANRQVHPIRSFAQVIKLQRWPVFAETVG